MKTLAPALALLLPGLAFAQQQTPPAAAQPPSPGAPAPTRTEEPPPPKKESTGGIAVEGFVGPASFSHPEAGGLGYGGAIRFLKQKGLHTDFGILIGGSSYSAKGLKASGVPFDNSQSQFGGGLELNVGFGVSVVELMGGTGAGLTWMDGTLTGPVGGDRKYENHPEFYVSYGAALAVNVGPVRPVFRLTRVVDTGFDPQTGQVGDASSLMMLVGLGLKVSSW